MSQSTIRKAFESRLKAWAVTKGFAVAYENVGFTDTSGTYLRSFILPAQTQSQTLDGVNRDYSGVYQVSIYVPISSGAKIANDLAAEIDALYPVSFTQDGLRIWMTAPMGVRPARQEDDKFILPVSGNYRAEA